MASAKPGAVQGPCGGGAVRLAPAASVLALAEGLETSLSVQLLYGEPVWAALSGGNLARVALPDDATRVVIYGDADDEGRAYAEAAAAEFHAQGRQVELAFPVEPCQDFNDVLMANAAELAA